jgi:hypothetical protein
MEIFMFRNLDLLPSSGGHDCLYDSWEGPRFVTRSAQEANGECLYLPRYGSSDVQDLFLS